MSVVAQLSQQWRQCGVEPGDTLLVHSDLRRTLRTARKSGHRLTPEDVLESFLDAIGPDGTLLLPTFNFDFTSGKPFDIRQTPSQMGVLTEAGRQQARNIIAGETLRQQTDFAGFLARRAAEPGHTFRQHLRRVGGAIEE